MKNRIIVLFLSVLCILLFCIQVKKNNPLLPDFQGDYRLSILRSGIPDSLSVFHEYAVACSTGADTFSTYEIGGSAASVMVVDSIRFGRLDSMLFHFTAAFDGVVRVEGVRPNTMTVDDSIPVHVVNPYSVIGDSVAVANEANFYRIGRPAADTPAVALKVIWTIPGLARDTTRIDSVITVVPATSQPRCTVSAVLSDAAGHSLALTPVYIRVNTAIRPVLSSAAITSLVTLGRPLTVAVALSGTAGADTTPYQIFATYGGAWRDSSAVLHFNRIDTITLGRIITDTGAATFTIFTVNSSGLKSNEVKIYTAITYSLPVISFTAETLLVSLNDTFPVTVYSAPAAEKYLWSLDLIKSDTTASPNFHVLLADSLFHTLTVRGIDRFGYVGKPASIIVYARPFEYVIQPVSFPVDAKARSWTAWIAGVNNTARAVQKNAKYTWSVAPANDDSVKYGGAQNDTMWLLFKDSAHAIVTVVIADTANGHCAPYSKSVSVRRYAPSLTFKINSVDARTTDDIVLGVSVADSNADGSIDSIFWHRGGKNAVSYASASKDSVWSFRSNAPDTFWLSAYCRDNDGFPSARDSVHVFVRAFQPYIQPPMNDTTVFINSLVSFTVPGHVSDTTATIAKYFWDFDANGTWDDSVSGALETHTFPLAGIAKVIVKCRDSKGLESAADTFRVTVSRGGPVVNGLSPDSVWVKDSVSYSVSAREITPNVKIVSYGISWAGGTAFTSYASPTAKNVFATNGIKYVRIFAVDSNAISSDTVTDSVVVMADIPVVDSIRADSTIFVSDVRAYTVFAHDPHSAIDSFKIFWGTSSNVSGTGTFSHAFLTTEYGPHPVRAIVKNHSGFWSDTVTQVMTVRLGKPVVDGLTPQTIWVNDDTTFAIAAHDTNGTVDSLVVDWADGTAAVRKARTDVLSHTYTVAQSGAKTIKVLAKDNDGIYSDTAYVPLNVQLGRPIVSGIVSDTNTLRIFISDPITFAISYSDPNGTVDSISVDNGTGLFGAFTKAPAGTYALSRTFARAEAGSKTVRVIVKDNDGILSDTVRDTVKVRLGAPVVDSVAIDTTGNNIFVKDLRTYRVYARDTNGTIKWIYGSWNGGTTPDTSVAVNIAAGGSATVSHAYDVGLAGSRTARFWVRDDDSVMSSSKDTTITVRLAPPVLWGDNPTKDTVWTIINNGYGINYNVHINSYDTNGTIGRYYWSEAGSFDSTTATKTNDSLYSRLIGINDVNHAFPIWIYGRDNDGLLRGRNFIAFADSAPTAPITTVDKPTGQIRIGWIGKDVKDGNGTMFKIVLKKGSAPASTDTLIDFTSGTSLSPGLNGYDFSYTFIPSGGNGTYYYQVISKDARGSTSFNSASFFNFP